MQEDGLAAVCEWSSLKELGLLVSGPKGLVKRFLNQEDDLHFRN